VMRLWRSCTGQNHMRLHLQFKNFDAVQTRPALFVNGAQAREFTIRNVEAIWFDRLLLAGSEALRRNEGGLGYESSGKRPVITAIELESQARANE
jgi:hypothetical protein